MGTDRVRSTAMAAADRSKYPVRKIQLEQEGEDPELRDLTPSQRVAMVWQLTVQAWTFKEGRWDEPRLRRDVVRAVRGGR
jgi:hypothetical protein